MSSAADMVTCRQLERAWDAGYRYSAEHADRAVEFFARFLRHSKGEWAGKPFELLRWQEQDVIRPLFGWLHADSRRRLYRKASVWIPKKNGKSTLAAGIGLYMMAADCEPGAEVYSCAVDRDQAGIVHREAIAMVESSPHLAARFHILKTRNTIWDPHSRSLYKALAHNPQGNEGLNPSCLVVDEIHAWKSPEFWKVLRYSQAARAQPITLIISTAGVYDEESIGWEQYEEARRVLAGELDDLHTLAVIYEAPKTAPWDQPETWRLANPSYEITLSPAEMAASAREAERIPRQRLSFERYRLNRWVDQADQWIPWDVWAAAGDPSLTLDEFTGNCFLGLDLSSTTDLTALVLLGEIGDRLAVFPFFWIPAAKLAAGDGPDYRAWRDAGAIDVCAGDSIRDQDILARVDALVAKHACIKLVFDRWNCAHISETVRSTIGLDTSAMQQSPRQYHEPCIRLEKLLIDGRLRHPMNPALNWCVGNAVVKEDQAGHVMPAKPSRSRRIDGCAAMLMALAGYLFTPGFGGSTLPLDDNGPDLSRAESGHSANPGKPPAER